MPVSISNIALKNFSFEEGLLKISQLGIRGVELAPSLLWENPLSASKTERKRIKNVIQEHGVSVVGLHALFYKKPELQIFGTSEIRERCVGHLKGMVELCHDLGGGILSFGAAGNRKRGEKSFEEAFSSSIDFFRAIAQDAADGGVVVCLEPLAPDYGCEFILNMNEGARLVHVVNHPQFQLLCDTGNMALNKEPPSEIFATYRDIIHHIHINDPHLSAPGRKGIDHHDFARVIQEIGYQGWLTLEFQFSQGSLGQETAYALECYGGYKGQKAPSSR